MIFKKVILAVTVATLFSSFYAQANLYTLEKEAGCKKRAKIGFTVSLSCLVTSIAFKLIEEASVVTSRFTGCKSKEHHTLVGTIAMLCYACYASCYGIKKSAEAEFIHTERMKLEQAKGDSQKHTQTLEIKNVSHQRGK